MAVWASSKIVQLDVTGVSTLSGIFLAGLFPHVLPFGSDKSTQAAEYEGFTARFNSLNVRSGSSVSIPRASAICGEMTGSFRLRAIRPKEPYGGTKLLGSPGEILLDAVHDGLNLPP